ncbi:asparagine synthetase B family protein [Acidicapsa ligni]|uniref:asparagine synthetase B family protein n=1 Tax=Acidicapsa ligni TaxID=542300 RepID=UPI0021DF594B|nr:asparagine synthetase B family protein [Acidicapsa ligni]
MSALAGIIEFDPRDSIGESELFELARTLDRTGPDGGAQHHEGNVGLVFRAFHTTSEAQREMQPMVCGNRVFTWDGRLDNREEIASRLGLRSDHVPTDLDLVVAAYQKWETRTFAELLGDWALAIWDRTKQELYLAKDCFGVRPLFYIRKSSRLIWSTTLESLATDRSPGLHVDKDHIAGCFFPYPRLGTTSFEEIKGVLPAHFLTVRRGGQCSSTRYWALNPHSRVRYQKDSDYEEHFIELFRNSVRRRLRSNRPILSELSGGLDSTAIVCMADDIRRTVDTPDIETISYFDADEPTGDERPYFTAVEAHRGKVGHHLSVAEFNRQTREQAFSPVPNRYKIASPGYFARSLHWAGIIDGVHQATGSRVTLCGLGGDELLGGVQYEALELLEYLLSPNLPRFAASLWCWSQEKRKPISAIVKSVFTLATARYSLASFLDIQGDIPWVLVRPTRPNPILETFSPWRVLSPTHLFAETIRYTISAQLSCQEPTPVGMSEKRYPFLDRSLYEYVASIPRNQVIRPGQRRRLMRRSLQGLVPDFVLSRTSKWFAHRAPAAQLRDQQKLLKSLFAERWMSHGVLFDTDLIRNRLRHVEHGIVSESRHLITALSIEQWLRRQTSLGVIAWDNRENDISADHDEKAVAAHGLPC